MDDWNDLRHLLAVAREQTLVGAARRLGVNQTTVGRRIGALEQELGSRLFNRVDQRMIPTATGEAALRTAERVEREVLGAAAEIAGSDDSLEGDVRVTSVSSIVNNVLAPQVNDLLSKFPGIHLDLLSGQGNLDLNHLEADLALRLGRPTAPNLVTKRVGALGYSVYVLARYASRSDELPWLAYSDTVEQFPEAQWFAAQCRGEPTLLRVDSAITRLSIVTTTPCRALLPCVLGENHPDLVRLGSAEPAVSREVWLIYMKALRRNARIMAVSEWATNACALNLK